MFDMQKVGKRIATYRKKIDMTQMELADRMNISFQAISNWERGLSMPDISKLPELAAIFGITIDELLEEKSDFIQSVVNDKIETYLEQKECSAEEIGQAIPLLKPSQIDAVVEHVQTNSNISIAALLPFMDEDGVKELALQALAAGESVNAYLPFMDEDDIKDLALQVHSRGGAISAFLEFMDEDGVKELALQALARGESVNAYLPLMDEDDIKDLALQVHSRGESISAFLEFMDEDGVKELALQALARGESVNAYLPYMDEDGVKELALKILRS